ncbi:MAG TPA: DUF4928 family protein [Tepidisphaeraceae bacterium]|nr:DUF4928 family protein [Tepidisphaeraceae bacterium]
MNFSDDLLPLLDEWYERLAMLRGSTQRGQGTYFGALVILQNLIEAYNLDPSGHFTDEGEGGRISGTSAERVESILAALDPRIQVNQYAGRTSTGPTKAARILLQVFQRAGLDRVNGEERGQLLHLCQKYMCDRLWQLQAGRPIYFVLDPALTLKQNLARLIEQQREYERDRAVAQHLVGAKLELRFPRKHYPDVIINRDSVDAADASEQKPGDFVVGDSVFHVTIAPTKKHFEKCEQNVLSNLRPILLVPEIQLAAVAGALRLQYSTKIDVFSIESFIAQNVEELSAFSYGSMRSRVRDLVQIYNDRIDQAERGKPYLRIDVSRL